MPQNTLSHTAPLGPTNLFLSTKKLLTGLRPHQRRRLEASFPSSLSAPFRPLPAALSPPPWPSAAATTRLATLPRPGVTRRKSPSLTRRARGEGIVRMVVRSSSAVAGTLRVNAFMAACEDRAELGRRRWIKATNGRV
jgi:hypothetical protein